MDNGSSGGAVVVSQQALADAHRFGVSAVPAPFPLNFTFIPWHAHDSQRFVYCKWEGPPDRLRGDATGMRRQRNSSPTAVTGAADAFARRCLHIDRSPRQLHPVGV